MSMIFLPLLHLFNIWALCLLLLIYLKHIIFLTASQGATPGSAVLEKSHEKPIEERPVEEEPLEEIRLDEDLKNLFPEANDVSEQVKEEKKKKKEVWRRK